MTAALNGSNKFKYVDGLASALTDARSLDSDVSTGGYLAYTSADVSGYCGSGGDDVSTKCPAAAAKYF